MATKPVAPKHLSHASKKFYKRLADDYQLHDEPHALETLRLACEALDRAEEARDTIAREGATYVDRFGSPRAHPAVKIEHDSGIRAMRALRELSLDGDIGDPRIPRVNGARS